MSLLELRDGQRPAVLAKLVEIPHGLVAVALADRAAGRTPCWQYWMYSEQTWATSHSPLSAGSAVGRHLPGSFTRARARSAALRFSLPRIRLPSSSNNGTRRFVPGGV